MSDIKLYEEPAVVAAMEALGVGDCNITDDGSVVMIDNELVEVIADRKTDGLLDVHTVDGEDSDIEDFWAALNQAPE